MFQSAPALVTPGNLVAAGWPETLTVSIRPGARHAGEPGRRHGAGCSSSFNPPRRSSRRGTALAANADNVSRTFQSAPALVTPGNRTGAQAHISVLQFQSAPALVTPGNSATCCGTTPACCFNPPRRSSRRGTFWGDTPETGTMFQSAPALVTPGNCRDHDRRRPPGAVSIRPGARHAGERPVDRPQGPAGCVSIRPGARHAGERSGCGCFPWPASCFNPPRRSSRRGTPRGKSASARRCSFNPPRRSSRRGTTRATACSPSWRSFNPPRRSSRRGTEQVRHPHLQPDVSIRPGARHAGEPEALQILPVLR